MSSLVNAKGNFPCLPQLPSRTEAVSIKNPPPPCVYVPVRGNPRSWLRLGSQTLPTQDWSSRELNKWVFLYVRGDYFTPCQQKICGQSCSTFHTADFIRVRGLMTRLHFLVHLGSFLWLPLWGCLQKLACSALECVASGTGWASQRCGWGGA